MHLGIRVTGQVEEEEEEGEEEEEEGEEEEGEGEEEVEEEKEEGEGEEAPPEIHDNGIHDSSLEGNREKCKETILPTKTNESLGTGNCVWSRSVGGRWRVRVFITGIYRGSFLIRG